jgi:hypothetical protein
MGVLVSKPIKLKQNDGKRKKFGIGSQKSNIRGQMSEV